MSATQIQKSNKTEYPHAHRATLLLLILALLAIYVLLPQLKWFKSSISTIRHADIALVFAGIVFVGLTYLAAAASYWVIGYFKLRYFRTVLIEVADGFTNRLLPIGAGGIATNAAYLIKQKRGRLIASLVVGLNSVLGLIGHTVLLLLLLLVSDTPPTRIITVHLPEHFWLFASVAALLALSYLASRRGIIKATLANIKTITSLVKFGLAHTGRLLLALMSSMSLTLCYVLTLYMVMLALNVHVSFLQAFYVLTVGVAAMVVTPTPGGLGGVEAGIVAAQISVGVSADQALSVALVFRLLTYWLPIIPGFFAFKTALNRGYLSFSD